MGPEGAGNLMQAFWRDTVEFMPILMSGVALTIIDTAGGDGNMTASAIEDSAISGRGRAPPWQENASAGYSEKAR